MVHSVAKTSKVLRKLVWWYRHDTTRLPLQVLVLASNSFQPFPSHCKDGSGPIQTLSGSELQLRSQGKAARDDFAQKVPVSSRKASC